MSKHFNIEQNKQSGEILNNSSVINKIYNMIIQDELTNDVFDNSNFIGKIYTTPTYQEYIDKINNINYFPNLEINPSSIYIKIEDEVVKQIFINAGLSADNQGMTIDDFNNINYRDQINDLFKNNSQIKNLMCLQYIDLPAGDYWGIFDNIPNLEQLYVPDCLLSLHNGSYNGIFKNNSNLKNVVFGNNSVCNEFGYALFENCINLEMSLLPSSLTTIYNSAFKNCSKITINDSNNVTFISDTTFENCNSITSFIIRNKVTNLGGSAFYNCKNLETVIFEDGNNNTPLSLGREGSWDGGIFRNTKVSKIILPSRLSSCGNACLAGDHIKTIIFTGLTPPECGYPFSDITKIYIPNEANMDDYKSALNRTTNIFFISNYTE